MLPLVAPQAEDKTPLRASKPVGKPSTPEQKKLLGACQDFESVMLGMIYKQMSSGASKDDPLSKGAGSDTWRDMLADERAKAMTKAGGIGLADGIYRQLANRV